MAKRDPEIVDPGRAGIVTAQASRRRFRFTDW